MVFTLDLANVFGLLGVVFSLASFSMKRMLPLRVLAIVANVCFIGYGLSLSAWFGVILNCILLPVNLRRLWEIRKLSREITRATGELPVSEWLLPHMRRRSFRSAEVLFRKGEVADRLFYVAGGQLRLAEIDRVIGPGQLLGEIGLFAPDRLRTQTAVCDTDGELYEMTDEMLFQLSYQHPKIGFHIVRLVAERLLRDLQGQQAATQAA